MVEGVSMRMSLLLLSLSFAACTKPNPNVCCNDAADCERVGLTEPKGCDDGLACRGNVCVLEVCDTSAECDPSAPYCVVEPDGTCQASCTTDSQCPGFAQTAAQEFCESGSCVECRSDGEDCSGTTPVCEAGRCVACSANDQCASGACDVDGSCVEESRIAYVDRAGAASSECSALAPCSTIERALSLVPPRAVLVISPGMYSRAGTLTITGTRRLIGSGATRALITRSGQGPIITVSGADDVSLEHLEISGATGTGTVETTRGHGVLCTLGAGAPMMSLDDVVLRNNAFSGISSRNCTLTATRTRFDNNSGSGVLLTDSRGTFDACSFANNGFEGANFDGGLYSVTNSYFTRNGQRGLALFTFEDASTVRFEFNTIADNNPTAPVGSREGINCGSNSGIVAAQNNLIVRNTAVGTCTYPSSILTNDVASVNFASADTAPFDYHIQPGSIAIDAATVTTIDHDFDGDPRPSNAADIGADEL